MENNYQIISTEYDHDMDWFSIEGWKNPAKTLPDVFIDSKSQRKVKKVMMLVKSVAGKILTDIGYWYPDRFMTIEFDDWDDYDPKTYPYTEDDPDKQCVWLREGFYIMNDCDNCDNHYYEHVNVVAWKYLPEIPQFFKDGK
jgi:hypothetical protein